MTTPKDAARDFGSTDCSSAMTKYVDMMRAAYEEARQSRDDNAKADITHNVQWWDGVMKGLNIAKRILDEVANGETR